MQHADTSLVMFDGTTAAFAYDANGNVTELVALDGSPAAAYAYDPFGNTTSATGSLAAVNPYRFSTKYTDDETGLVYYGYRFYHPELGRWINRDPIGEMSTRHRLLARAGIRVLPQSVPLLMSAMDLPECSDTSDCASKMHAQISTSLDAIFSQQSYGFACNNPLAYVDPDGKEAISITVGSGVLVGGGAAVGVGAAVGGAAVVGAGAIGYGVGTVLDQTIGISDWIARMATRWSCEGQCNLQAIGSTCCPDRSYGFGVGPTQSMACQMAKRSATQSCPRGCYPRHCYCPRCWRN